MHTHTHTLSNGRPAGRSISEPVRAIKPTDWPAAGRPERRGRLMSGGATPGSPGGAVSGRWAWRRQPARARSRPGAQGWRPEPTGARSCGTLAAGNGLRNLQPSAPVTFAWVNFGRPISGSNANLGAAADAHTPASASKLALRLAFGSKRSQLEPVNRPDVVPLARHSRRPARRSSVCRDSGRAQANWAASNCRVSPCRRHWPAGRPPACRHVKMNRPIVRWHGEPATEGVRKLPSGRQKIPLMTSRDVNWRCRPAGRYQSRAHYSPPPPAGHDGRQQTSRRPATATSSPGHRRHRAHLLVGISGCARARAPNLLTHKLSCQMDGQLRSTRLTNTNVCTNASVAETNHPMAPPVVDLAESNKIIT